LTKMTIPAMSMKSREEIKLHLLLSRLEEHLECLSSSSGAKDQAKVERDSLDKWVPEPARIRLYLKDAHIWLKELEKLAQ
jgi:hypothetical protein